MLYLHTTVYLDSHTYGYNPLLLELKALRLSPRNDHIILIDDVRMFGHPEWLGITQPQAMELLMAINPAYRVSYEDTDNAAGDLLVAQVMPDDAAMGE